MPEYRRALVWMRRDLRDYAHAARYHALKHALKHASEVCCAFVFDRDILDWLPDPADRRVEFRHASATELQAALQALGGGLIVRHGHAREEIVALATELGADVVFFNHDDDPTSVARDAAVGAALMQPGIAVRHYKDCEIFERDELLTAAGTPFASLQALGFEPTQGFHLPTGMRSGSPIFCSASTATATRATSRRAKARRTCR
jgi:deoxyribodipyrimidine photo-lyase